MKFKVYEWDFVACEGDLKLTTDNFEEAKTESLKIANSFCEDEKPDFYKVGKATNKEADSWNAFTGCDFGAKIILVQPKTCEHDFEEVQEVVSGGLSGCTISETTKLVCKKCGYEEIEDIRIGTSD